MSKVARASFTVMLAVASAGIGFTSEKKDFAEHYKNKYFVVMRDELSLAVCNDPQLTTALSVRVSESGAEYRSKIDPYAAVGCEDVLVPMHKGAGSHDMIFMSWTLRFRRGSHQSQGHISPTEEPTSPKP